MSSDPTIQALVEQALVTPELNGNGHEPAEQGIPIYSMVDMWEFQQGLKEAWGGWILVNNITVIGGASNVGKSPMVLALVKGYLEGHWPDGTPVPTEMIGGNVVYCIPEGFGEQTELLATWGIPRQVIHERVKMPALPTPGAPEVPNFIFKLDTGDGAATLNYYCEQVKPRLIVVDGLRAAMTGDESNSTDVDRFMAPMIRLAIQYNAAVLITHHPTKGTESQSRDGVLPTIDWFRGSGDIVGKARSAWWVDQPNPTAPEHRRITLVKAARGPKGITMGFAMGDPADGVVFTPAAPRPPAKTKADRAKEWILEALRDGALQFDDLVERAADEGCDFSESTLTKARTDLRAKNRIVQLDRMTDEGKRTYWALASWEMVDNFAT